MVGILILVLIPIKLQNCTGSTQISDKTSAMYLERYSSKIREVWVVRSGHHQRSDQHM